MATRAPEAKNKLPIRTLIIASALSFVLSAVAEREMKAAGVSVEISLPIEISF